MMAIAWILYGLIRWQPEPQCHDPIGVLSATGCWNRMVPPFEIYYQWAPPTVMTLESHYE